MSRHYKLDGKTVVPCDLMEWAESFDNDRRVAWTEVAGCQVSTVFLGLDNSFGHGKILLFETMIFGGPHDGYCERYSTWDEAEAGHAVAVALVSEEEPKA